MPLDVSGLAWSYKFWAQFIQAVFNREHALWV